MSKRDLINILKVARQDPKISAAKLAEHLEKCSVPGVGDIVVTESTMYSTTGRYLHKSILEEHLEPSVDDLGLGTQWTIIESIQLM